MSCVMTSVFRNGFPRVLKIDFDWRIIGGHGQGQSPERLAFANFCRIVLDQVPPETAKAWLS